ncbi:YchJ family protein [Streptacidiphilus carbonis]|uniref:YchJ family protein n=1 Tax=Streptacidiphilus carbonis TaxID=105422 RepID=UPI000ACA0C2B|nr:YchJ family metal-binding protein [Streptacidiphilus carbonis]
MSRRSKARNSKARTSSSSRSGSGTAKAGARRTAAAPAATFPLDADCPCGFGKPYGECCGPFHAATTPEPGRAPVPAPATAELLMRSRYSAFAVGDTAYLLRSWHSSTRPPLLALDPEQRWLGLEVLGSGEGGPFHLAGTVEFRARFAEGGEEGVLHEHSRFIREGGMWVYLDALPDRPGRG